MTSFSLAGRTALVTGASRGIGEGIARLFAGAGAATVLASRDVERLEELASELGAAGGRAAVLELDLDRPSEVAERLEALPDELATIDILVNNAGITADNLLLRMDLEEWERVLRVNLTGTYALTRAVVRGMIRRRWGRVISISSVVGLMGNAGQANYAAAKAGLIGFTKSVARELASRNVTVNAIAPGYIQTEMTGKLAEETRKALRDAIPVKRLGSPEDVAHAALYLASEEAAYVTGHVLNVSGGLFI